MQRFAQAQWRIFFPPTHPRSSPQFHSPFDFSELLKIRRRREFRHEGLSSSDVCELERVARRIAHEDVFEVERTEASRSGSVFHDSPSDVSKFHGTQGFLQCSSSYFKAFQTQRAQDVVDLGKERHVDHVLERLISGICGTACVSWISTGGST